MVALRVGFGAMLLLLVIGCGGEVPKPANSTSPPAMPTDTNKPSTEKPAVVKPDESSVATATAPKSTPVKPDTTPSAGADSRPPDPTPPEPLFQLETGFTLLKFSDFEAFAAEEDTWEETDEGMICSGKPLGYLYSKQPYQNFTLRVDYRFPRPASLKDEAKFAGNTGFLIYITGEHKQWPVCLEVQGKHVQMGAIKENGGAQPVTATDDDAARQKARHPVGQWNSLEIVSTNGVLSVSLNGIPISKCEPDFLSEGLIGIQSEKHPFEVRRMRIRPNP